MKVSTQPQKSQIYTVILECYHKSAVTHSKEKPVLLNFVNLS